MLFRRITEAEARSLNEKRELLFGLASRDVEERRRAIAGLAQRGDTDLLTVFERSLKDPDEAVRLRAAEALAAFPVEHLIEALESGSDGERCTAARVLGRRACAEAVPALSAALQSARSAEVADTVLLALVRMETREAARALAQAPEPVVRRSIPLLVRAFKANPVAEAVPLLWSFLANPDEELAARVGLCLIQINERNKTVAGLLRPLYLRSDPMLHADPRLAPHLVRVLEYGARPLRLTAARWLGRIAAASPTPRLAEAVPLLNRQLGFFNWSSDNDREVYLNALEAIHRSTRRSAQYPLPAGAPDPGTANLPRPAEAEAPDLGSLPVAPASETG